MTPASAKSGRQSDSLAKKVAALDEQLQKGGVRAANVLCDLLALVPQCPAAAHAVRRGLSLLKKQFRSAQLQGADPALQNWLDDRRREYASSLAAVFEQEDAECRRSAQQSGVAGETALACAAVQGEATWKTVLHAVLKAKRSSLLSDFVQKYLSLRIWALEVIVDCARTSTRATTAKSSVSIPRSEIIILLHLCGKKEPELDFVTELNDSKKESAEFDNVATDRRKLLRKAFGEAWLVVLADDGLTIDQRTECLECIPTEVIPRMSNPLRLSDYLTDCYNNSREIQFSISALDALFVLISKYRLDYPLFYPKLYALLTPDSLFYAPHRRRFLELTGLFLTKGSYLPRTMVAAFIKRLVRRALLAPPAGAMWCLRLGLELLRKHPSTLFLVHKIVDLFEEPTSLAVPRKRVDLQGQDPYDDEEDDPIASGADETSLWELETLRHHMSPGVSRLVNAFSLDARKHPAPLPGTLEDLASLEFSDIFEAEFRHRVKTVPIAYDPPGAGAPASVEHSLSSVLQWR